MCGLIFQNKDRGGGRIRGQERVGWGGDDNRCDNREREAKERERGSKDIDYSQKHSQRQARTQESERRKGGRVKNTVREKEKEGKKGGRV